MIYTEYYSCRCCNEIWQHHWDTEDYNNDYSICPNCNQVDFYEITESTFFKRKIELDFPD